MKFLSRLFGGRPVLSIDSFNYTREVPLKQLSDGDIITVEFIRFIFNGLLKNYDKMAREVPGIAKMQTADPKFMLKSSVEFCLFLWYSLYRSTDGLGITEAASKAIFASLESSIEKLVKTEIRQAGYSDFKHFASDRHTLFENIVASETPKLFGFNLEHRYVRLLMSVPLSFVEDINLEEEPYIYIGNGLGESAWCVQRLLTSMDIFGDKMKEQLLQNINQNPPPSYLKTLRKQ